MKRITATALFGAASLVLVFGSARAATPCFFINQWQGWKAPNLHTLYLGVTPHEVYEVDLSGDYDLLQDPDARLISHSQGPDTVCVALDLQLVVATPDGMSEPLIPIHMRKLTPAEVAAIPKPYRPD